MDCKKLYAGLLFAATFAACSAQRGLPPAPGQTATSAVAGAALPAAQDESADAKEKQLARGKELFVARCASCHDADGSKPLRHGPPLNQRPLTEQVIASQVGQRFRKASEADKQAAIAYVHSFLRSPSE